MTQETEFDTRRSNDAMKSQKMSSYVGVTQDLVITGKVLATKGVFGRLNDILKFGNSRQDMRTCCFHH